jgi:hypothetical protein
LAAEGGQLKGERDMAIVEEKKEKSENAEVKDSGCCGGASKEAAKLEEKKAEACATKPLDVKVEHKDKAHGSSCCG